MIVITDGIPTRNEENTEPEATSTRDANIKMYSVGITKFIDENTLKMLSSPPQLANQNYFASPDFDGLSNILDTVLSSTCQVVTPAPTPQPTATPTPRPTTTPTSPSTSPATNCNEILLDLALIVDGSGSICENDASYANGKCNNWRSIINFMVNIIDVLGVESGKTRVALVLFSTDAELKWTLDRYTNKNDLVNALRMLEDQYPEGWTNTADAFSMTRTQVFGQSGDRSSADNLAIIITDGIPTRNEARAIPEAENLQNSNVKVYAIGITQFIDESTLSSFSSQPRRKDQEYFSSPDFDSLNNILASLLSSTCVTPAPATPAPVTPAPATTTTRITPAPATLSTSSITTPPSTTPVSCGEVLVDLAFLVDGSGSICENDNTFANGLCDNWRSIINFMISMVNSMSIDDGRVRVGLVLFSTDAELRWNLEGYSSKSSLVDAIRALENAYPEGWTNTADAFSMTRTQVFNTNGDRSNAQNLAIIITDGIPTRNEAEAIPQAQNLQNENVKVYAIGITKFIDESTLSSFSSLPRQLDTNYFTTPDFAGLDNILASVLSSTVGCTPAPTAPTPPSTTPTTTTTTLSTTTARCTDAKMDLIFIVDGSGSVCESDPSYQNGICENWKRVVEFMVNIVNILTEDNLRSRVSVILFSDEAEVQWNLNRYTAKSELLNAINDLQGAYPSGWTNTADAFQAARNQVFNSAGDRTDAPNVAITITDGYPSRRPEAAIPEANLLAQSGVQMFAVGVTADINEDTLKQFSSYPKVKDENYFLTPDFNGLRLVVDQFVKSVCSGTTTTLSSTTSRSSTTSVTTPSTISTSKPVCNNGLMDIAFVVDASSSICQDDPSFKDKTCANWETVITFLVNIISRLDIGDKVRVGLILFSDSAITQWNLDTYTTKTELLSAVDKLRRAYLEGFTNTADAFDKAGTEIFRSSADRSAAPNTLFIITDGMPTKRQEAAPYSANKLKADGVTIYAIGITPNINEDELKAYSSPPQGKNQNYFTTPNFNGLNDILEEVLTQAGACPTSRPPTPSTSTTLSTTLKPGCENANIDLAFIVDGSGSICEGDPTFANGVCDNWRAVINFMVNIVSSLTIDSTMSRVAVVIYSDDAAIKWTLDRYPTKDSLVSAIMALNDEYPEGWTNTADAFHLTRTEIFGNGADRPQAENVVIIITDGLPNRNPERAIPEAKNLQNEGVRVYAVGISSVIDENTLRQFSSAPQEKDATYFVAQDFSGLANIIDTVLESTCGTPSSRPTPASTTRAPTPSTSRRPDCGDSDIDLVLVVDGSGSICENDPTLANGVCDNWRLVVQFLVDIVESLPVDDGKARVGLVLFSTEAEVSWMLDRYNSKSEIQNAIRGLVFPEGWTNTADALLKMRSQIFTQSGDRSGADNVAIIVTDGVPTRNMENTMPEADAARAQNIKMYSVGITKFIDEDTLRSLSSSPQLRDTNYFTSPDFSGLQTILDQVISSAACVTPSPPPPSTSTTTRPPTSPTSQTTTRTSCEEALVDLAFMVDSSGSICENDPSYASGKCANWVLIINFMANIIGNLGISGDKTRVAVVMFSTDAETKWRLDRYIGDSSGLTSAVRSLEDQYSEGWTNTADGLLKVRTEVFGQNGDRSNADNMVIIITDGIPTRNEANTMPEADALRNTGASMFAVGITQFIDENTLRGLSSGTQEKDKNYFTSPDFAGLDNILASLLSSTCGATPAPTPAPTPSSTTPATTPATQGRSTPPFSSTTRPSSCEDAQLDLTFVVDGSGSICENDPTFANGRCNNWMLMISFMNSIVDTLSIDQDKTRVALVLYSTEAETKWTLDRYIMDKSGLQAAIQALESEYPEGWTNTADALLKARTEVYGQSGDRSNGDNMIIIVTDGIPTRNEGNTQTEADAVHQAGIKVYAIGITQFIDEATLKFLSSSPQERDNNYFISPDFNGLQNILDSVLQRTCGNTPAPTTPAPGITTTSTSVVPTTNPPQPTPSPTTRPSCVETKADLVFVVDGSGSICENDPTYRKTTIDGSALCDNWVNIVNFVASITDAVTISADRTQVGLVLFSSEVSKVITLDQYTEKGSLLTAIRQLENEYPEGWTNTADAFRSMRQDVFTRMGDRSDAENIAVVITDGVPTRNEPEAIPEAENAQNQNIKMYTIGITQFIDESYLKAFSSSPRELNTNYFMTPDFSGLSNILSDVLFSTCGGGNTLPPNPTPGPTPGPTPAPTQNPTALPTTGDTCRTDKMDLVFVLDSSGSICDKDPTAIPNGACNNWRLVVSFMQDLVMNFIIGPSNVRVALVQFANHGNVKFLLDEYSTSYGLVEAFEQIKTRFPGGRTNTYAGLRAMRTRVFGQSGDRADATNVAILITDGYPTVNTTYEIPEAEQAHREKIIIFGVGITNDVDEENLKLLSYPPQELNKNYLLTENFEGLGTIMTPLLQNVCQIKT